MTHQSSPSRLLSISLWSAQVLLALLLAGGAIFKLVTSMETLGELWPWVLSNPRLLRFTAFIDLVGGIGIILPSMTRIKPSLVIWTAIGIILLQLSAIGFHVSRGEVADTGFNYFVLSLAVLVLWGRKQHV